MRIVEVTKNFSRNGLTFIGGHRYVMAEDVEAQYRSIFNEWFGMSYPIDSSYRKYNGENLNGKSFLIWRSGGIGDLHFISPVISYIKKKYPDSLLRVASGCKQPLENMPEISELYDMPFDADLLEKSDYHLMFQGIIETSSEISKRTHAVDMFYTYFSIDPSHIPDEFKKPRLYFTEEENKWADQEFKKLGIKEDDFVIGIQLETSSPLRNYPKDKLKEVVNILSSENNVHVCLIGSTQQNVMANWIRGSVPRIHVFTNYSVRQIIVMTQRYNIVVAPDSFMIQTAGGLDKPLLGIYGPFPSEIRMKYFSKAIALEPKVACSPCFKHDFRVCIKGYPSPCFTLISPEDILEALDYLRFKYYGDHFFYAGRFIIIPDLSKIEKYFLSIDKGLCFFGGYYRHDNMLHIDTDVLTNPDISDINTNLPHGEYPFVLFMNQLELQNGSVYHGSKKLVRPGGYFIVYKSECQDKIFQEIKKDIGSSFVVVFSENDPIKNAAIVVGKKPY